MLIPVDDFSEPYNINDIFSTPEVEHRIIEDSFFEYHHIEYNLKELKSPNENFLQENQMRYTLYPLYINWKKIENRKNKHPYYFNVFKVFGYFGVAIFSLLIEVNGDEYLYGLESFLFELYSYAVEYEKKIKPKENPFFIKLEGVYEEVISLLKNKIVVFKEITIFLIVLKLYHFYFLAIKEYNKGMQVLKYHYFLLSYLKNEEYKKIYKKFFKKLNRKIKDNIYSVEKKYLFHKKKTHYINYLKKQYKKINRELKKLKTEKEE